MTIPVGDLTVTIRGDDSGLRSTLADATASATQFQSAVQGVGANTATAAKAFGGLVENGIMAERGLQRVEFALFQVASAGDLGTNSLRSLSFGLGRLAPTALPVVGILVTLVEVIKHIKDASEAAQQAADDLADSQARWLEQHFKVAEGTTQLTRQRAALAAMTSELAAAEIKLAAAQEAEATAAERSTRRGFAAVAGELIRSLAAAAPGGLGNLLGGLATQLGADTAQAQVDRWQSVVDRIQTQMNRLTSIISQGIRHLADLNAQAKSDITELPHIVDKEYETVTAVIMNRLRTLAEESTRAFSKMQHDILASMGNMGEQLGASFNEAKDQIVLGSAQIVHAIGGIAEAFGTAIASGRIKDFFTGVEQTIARGLRNFGEALVAQGLGVIAMRASLANPFAAIAAGTALIALSAALSAAASASANSLSGGGSAFAAATSPVGQTQGSATFIFPAGSVFDPSNPTQVDAFVKMLATVSGRNIIVQRG